MIIAKNCWLANKLHIIALICFLFSLFIVIGSVMQLLDASKKQMICRNYLQHWGTALRLYEHQYQHWQKPAQQTSEQWIALIRSYLYTDVQCPSVPGGTGLHSYKVNGNAIPSTDAKPWASASRLVVAFDGLPDADLVVNGPFPYHRVANRHMGGANLLLGDGSVVFVNAYREGIMAGEMGWQTEGGYLWSPPK